MARSNPYAHGTTRSRLAALPKLTDDERARRHRVKIIRRCNTAMQGYRGHRVVMLMIDHQSFALDGVHDTVRDAWHRRTQLAIALERFAFGEGR